MNAPERLHRRLGGVVGTAGIERLGPAQLPAVLRELLFAGDTVPAWHSVAACRDSDPATFFPTGAGSALRVTAAKRICRGCPVRDACLADVMAWEAPSARHGVVGGLSANERHDVYRHGHEGGAR